MNTPRRPEPRGGNARRRPDLAGEHAFTDIGQLVLLAVFMAVWTTDSFVFRFSGFLSAHAPAFIRWPAGLAVVAASAPIAVAAHRRIFGDTAGRSGVVADGVYAIVRHPMYLGSWLCFLGLTLTTLSLAAAGVLLVMLAFYLFVSRHEEKLLLAVFGSRYREYQAATPMFFPLRFRALKRAGPSP
jgi:protein-S-isoprenylcysteine O-methyltransferase Ste14